MLLHALYNADIAIFFARIFKTLFFGVAAVVAMPFSLLWLLCVCVCVPAWDWLALHTPALLWAAHLGRHGLILYNF